MTDVARYGEPASSLVTKVSSTHCDAGKVFYLELDGEGRMPVLHFGMTGNIHVNETRSQNYPSLIKLCRSKTKFQYTTKRVREKAALTGLLAS